MVEEDGVCHDCKCIVAPRAKHCLKCDMCVDRYDHHCGWVNRCVGRNNLKRFHLFVWTQFAYLCFAATALGIYIVLEISYDHNAVDYETNLGHNKVHYYVLDTLIVILNLFFVISMMILLKVQVKNVCAGMSQNERLATNSRRD
jgi:hypothetical protein